MTEAQDAQIDRSEATQSESDAERKIRNRSTARDYISRLPLSTKARAFYLALQTCIEDAVDNGEAVMTSLGPIAAPTLEEIGSHIGKGKKRRATQLHANEARGTRYIEESKSDDGERSLWLILFHVIEAEIEDGERLTISREEREAAFDQAEELRERRPRPEEKPKRKREPEGAQRGAQLTFPTGAKRGARTGATGGAMRGASPIDNSQIDNSHSYRDFEFFPPNDGYAVPRWPREISPEHLREPSAVAELHRIAVHHGYITETDCSLRRMLELAHSRIRRFKASKTNNPGAELTASLKLWEKQGYEPIADRSNSSDEDWAIAALKTLEPHKPIDAKVAKTLPTIGKPAPDIVRDDDAERIRQEAALKNFETRRLAREPPDADTGGPSESFQTEKEPNE